MILIDLFPYIGLLLLTLLTPLFVKDKKKYMFFLFLVYFVFCGFRYGVGWDYYNYLNVIEHGGWRFEKTEFLVRQLDYFCERHGYTQFFFVATSFVIILLFFLMFAKESANPAVSIFVFLCIPTFFLNSLTLVRYFLAVATVFLACHYGYKKKYIVYFSLLFVAFLFHRAALFGLIMVPFVLIKREFGLATNLFIFITCFVLGTVIGSFSFMSSIFGFLSDTSLFGDIFESGEQYMQDTGNANFSRTPYVFALINLINLFSFQTKNTKTKNIKIKNTQIKNNQIENDQTENNQVENTQINQIKNNRIKKLRKKNRRIKDDQNNPKQQLGRYVTMYNIGSSLMFLFSFNAIFSNRLSLMFTVFLTLIVPYYKKKPIAKIAIYSICIFVFFYELTIKASHPLFIGRLNCWLPYRMNFSF
jgi:hypothetical protein